VWEGLWSGFYSKYTVYSGIRIRESVLMEMNNRMESQLHGLINNAGIMAVPFAMTKDGYESQFQVCYHFERPTLLLVD
jgi:hypothetical protein